MATVAQPLRRKRGYRWWGWRIAGALTILVLIVAGVIAASGAKAKADLKAKYPPPGQLVDVGGFNMHIASASHTPTHDLGCYFW